MTQNDNLNISACVPIKYSQTNPVSCAVDTDVTKGFGTPKKNNPTIFSEISLNWPK